MVIAEVGRMKKYFSLFVLLLFSGTGIAFGMTGDDFVFGFHNHGARVINNSQTVVVDCFLDYPQGLMGVVDLNQIQNGSIKYWYNKHAGARILNTTGLDIINIRDSIALGLMTDAEKENRHVVGHEGNIAIGLTVSAVEEMVGGHKHDNETMSEFLDRREQELTNQISAITASL